MNSVIISIVRSHLMGVSMQHWYACQVEVAPRGIHMHDCLYWLSLLIGAMQLPHDTHHVTFPEVVGTASHIYKQALSVN